MRYFPGTRTASLRRMSSQLSSTPTNRAVQRTADCPCNSRLRYKHCCGSASGLAARGPSHLVRLRQAGLQAQRRGDFSLAIAIYDGILREHAEDWDVAHMRAPSCYQLGAMGDAATAFAALLATPAVDSPGFWANLGVLLAAVCADPRAVWPGNRLDAHRYSRLDGPVTAPAPWPLPTVSVVMPAYMHAPFRRGYLATGESGAG